ncbi:MAG: hypothetical protein C0608_00075 [Deltaproteobacteria bacterium]|nr:MAG: hypothetical protein C0608_00075 [Deltaproteobacteria bacterium]
MNWAEALQWTYSFALLGGGSALISVGVRSPARVPWALSLLVVAMRHGIDAFMLGNKGYIYASYPFSLGYLGILLVALGCASVATGRRLKISILLYLAPLFAWIPLAAYLGLNRIAGVGPLFLTIVGVLFFAGIRVWSGVRSRELILILASSFVMVSISFAHLATALPPFGYSPIFWVLLFAIMLRFLIEERDREELSRISGGLQGALLADSAQRLVYISNIALFGQLTEFIGKHPSAIVAEQERKRFNEWLTSSKTSATFKLRGSDEPMEFSRGPSHFGTLFLIDHPNGEEPGEVDPYDALLNRIGVPALVADPVSGIIKGVNKGASPFAKVGEHFWNIAAPGGIETYKNEVEHSFLEGPRTFTANLLTHKGVARMSVRAERRIVGGRDSLIIELAGAGDDSRLTGTAHDLGNVLQTIVACCDNAGDTGVLSDVKNAALRGGDLAKELLSASAVGGAFPDSGADRVSMLDLSEVLHSLGALMRRALPNNFALELEVAGGLPRVPANRGHLEQIIMNLVINAREALAGYKDPQIILTLEGDHREVRISVSDNGPGVPPGLEERIFEEAFTTRVEDGGSGLGLMMAATLAELNSAKISLTANSNKGATFTLAFALKPRKIIIIDPDPLFRAQLASSLQLEGWEVTALSDGNGLIQDIKGLEFPPAAIITELIIPGEGARALVERLADEHPGIPVLAVTSLALPEALDGFKGAGVREVFQKLLPEEELVKRISEYLGKAL